MDEFDPREMPPHILQETLEEAHLGLKKCNKTRCYQALRTKEGAAAADLHCPQSQLRRLERTIKETQEFLEDMEMGGKIHKKSRSSSRKKSRRRNKTKHKKKKKSRRTSRNKKKVHRKKRK